MKKLLFFLFATTMAHAQQYVWTHRKLICQATLAILLLDSLLVNTVILVLDIAMESV